MKFVDLKTRKKSVKLEKADLQTHNGTLNRQIERYKNSLMEIEIIITKYDFINKSEQQGHVVEMMEQLKQEVEEVKILEQPIIVAKVEEKAKKIDIVEE